MKRFSFSGLTRGTSKRLFSDWAARIKAPLLLQACAIALGLQLAMPSYAQISDHVIRVGVLTDASGPYADLAGKGSFEAAKMAAESFGGKIGDAKIEVILGDEQSKPDIAANIARRWLDRDGVDMIIDVPGSSIALAVQEIVRAKGSILINSGAGALSFINERCSPNGFMWTYDTYMLAAGTAGEMTRRGGKRWFFITVDNAGGKSLQAEATKVVLKNGGIVLGSATHPINNSDFSSQLLLAKSSGADVIGLASSGADFVNLVRQANEFGINKGGRKLAGLVVFETDISSLGLETAQGLILTTPFYWDANAKSRDFSQKFIARTGKAPTMVQAGVYSGVLHYLEAVKAVGTDDPKSVIPQMRKTPVADAFAIAGEIRADGRMIGDAYVMQVKSPAESTGKFDMYKVIRKLKPEEAFSPLQDSTCALVQKK